MIIMVPFAYVRRLLGDGSMAASALPRLSEVEAHRARRIGRLVRHASGRTPWASTCYPQALTARAQLVAGRIPHTVSFGLRRNERGALIAHAWVMAGDVMVTGATADHYTEVGSFAWTPGSRFRRRR